MVNLDKYRGEVSEETGRIFCTGCQLWIAPGWWSRHVSRWHGEEEEAAISKEFED